MIASPAAIEQRDQNVELADGQAVTEAQLAVEGLHHGLVQQQEGTPGLPFGTAQVLVPAAA
jgi:hypothetical protein